MIQNKRPWGLAAAYVTAGWCMKIEGVSDLEARINRKAIKTEKPEVSAYPTVFFCYSKRKRQYFLSLLK